MRIRAWSSDVCSSDLCHPGQASAASPSCHPGQASVSEREPGPMAGTRSSRGPILLHVMPSLGAFDAVPIEDSRLGRALGPSMARSEEHTSELQSLMRISYAVFCLNKKTKQKTKT